MLRIVNRTLALAVCLGLLGLAGCRAKAKNWTFKDADGSIRTLSDYQGRVLVLAFTNTWCDPCQDAAPHLQMIHERFVNNGVKVLAVSSWEHADPETWMEEHGFTYGVMLDATEIARDYDVDTIPTFYVVGVEGHIIYRHEGFDSKTPTKLAQAVEKHLQKHGHQIMAGHGG